MTEVRRTVALLFLGAAFAGLAFFALQGDQLPFGERVAWRTLGDLRESRPAKPALLEFDAPWCGPCREMKARVYSRKDVAGFIEEHFFPVRIVVDDPEKLPKEEREILHYYGVSAYPTVLVINYQGQLVSRVEGFTDPEPFMAQLALAQEQSSRLLYDFLPKNDFTEASWQESTGERLRVVLLPMWSYSAMEDREAALSYQLFTSSFPKTELEFATANFAFYDFGRPVQPEEMRKARAFVKEHGLEQLPAAVVFSPDGQEVLATFSGDVRNLYPTLRRLAKAQRPEDMLGLVRWEPR